MEVDDFFTGGWTIKSAEIVLQVMGYLQSSLPHVNL